MKRAILRPFVLIVFLAVFLGLISWRASQPHKNGDSQAYAADTSSASQPAQNVDDATLKKAAAVFPRIRQINLDTRQTLKNTKDQHQQEQILARAQSEQLSVVRNAGMTAAQYNSVIKAVQNDPGVRTKFSSYLEQTGGSAH
jgi:TolA-binding protein